MDEGSSGSRHDQDLVSERLLLLRGGMSGVDGLRMAPVVGQEGSVAQHAPDASVTADAKEPDQGAAPGPHAKGRLMKAKLSSTSCAWPSG